MLEFLSENWPTVLLVFALLEKVVKLSPAKSDDILIDIILYGIYKFLGKPFNKRP